jgi:integrase
MRPRGVKNRRPKRPTERAVLSDLLVKKSQTKGELRRAIYDAKRPGLMLLVQPKSQHKTWKFLYRIDGRPRAFTIGRADRVTLKTAREVARALDAKVAAGIDVQAARIEAREAVTFRELVDRFLVHVRTTRKASTAYAYEKMLRRALPRLGSKAAASITPEDVHAVVAGVREKSATSAGYLTAILSSFFRWAGKLDGGGIKLPDNPARGLQRPKAAARTNLLPDDKIREFWAKVDDAGLHESTALKLVLLTGQRPGEVIHMRWQNIKRGEHSFDRATRTGKLQRQTHEGAWWELPGPPDGDDWPGTKNSQPHKVWLAPAALALLDEVNDAPPPEGRVFPDLEDLSRAMRPVCEAIGLEPGAVRPHDLRRTHGTLVTRLGFTRDAMNRVQNHREGGIGSVYDQNEYADEARRVQVAVGARIDALVNGTEAAAAIDLQVERKRRSA